MHLGLARHQQRWYAWHRHAWLLDFFKSLYLTGDVAHRKKCILPNVHYYQMHLLHNWTTRFTKTKRNMLSQILNHLPHMVLCLLFRLSEIISFGRTSVIKSAHMRTHMRYAMRCPPEAHRFGDAMRLQWCARFYAHRALMRCSKAQNKRASFKMSHS